VRVLAATNKNIEEMVRAKTFREDLYYRLNVVRIRMPALRERADDIPPIIDYILQTLEKTKKAKLKKVSPEALALLTRHRWPGNVRELENVIYRTAVIAQGDTILLKDLPQEIRDAAGEPSGASAEPVAAPAAGGPSLASALDALYAQLKAEHKEPILDFVEDELIRRTMKDEAGDLAKAAARLGLSKAALKKRAERFGAV
jgi:two-component system nitrogen regulation response regulator GlnG